MFANWIVDGTQYAFHKNWLYCQSRTESMAIWVGREETKKKAMQLISIYVINDSDYSELSIQERSQLANSPT